MLRVHLTDGRTLRFDLKDERHAAKWLRSARDLDFQSTITGITLKHGGVSYSLSRPRGCGNVFMFAEYLEENAAQKFKGGGRIICQADDTRINLMVHEAQRAAHVSLSKTGQQCYNPVIGARRG